MPRGKYYPEEMREEARRLRCEGWSLNEISVKLGPPKNTLTLWVRGIELSTDQRARLQAKELTAVTINRPLAAQAHRRARLVRIDIQNAKAKQFLNTPDDLDRINHIAAAMLYLAEGAKGENAFTFANSNPSIIRYWLYLLRNSFDIDESKFRVQVMARADQDDGTLLRYWIEITGIQRYIKTFVDARTEGKPTLHSDYKGVCKISYHDVSIRRYLDALAQGLMERALASGSDAL